MENGFQTESENSLENLLKNRGVLCGGGYEFSYGGIPEYDITRLISDIEKDWNMLQVLKNQKVTEAGLGIFVKDGISYYDVIFITNEAVNE